MRRLISAAPFRDRVVHHALCQVTEPAFERGFIACGRDAERAMIVGATAAGMRLLRTAGRLPNA